MRSFINKRGPWSITLFCSGVLTLVATLTMLILGLTGNADWWMASPTTLYLSLLPLILIALAIITDRSRPKSDRRGSRPHR